MDDNTNIKNELFSIYIEITKNIPNIKNLANKILINKDINTFDSLTLINCIKVYISLLIHNNNENIKLQEHYFQLENQLIKLEQESKYYLSNYFKYKVLKEALEIRLNSFTSLEEELEELKEKVKYNGGKFLENDRKENEILILRRENSTLKQEIKKLEKKNNKIKNKIKDYITKIKEYENSIEALSAKISQLEMTVKEKTFKNYGFFYKNLRKKNTISYLINSNNKSLEISDNSNNNKHSNFNFSINNLKSGFNSLNNLNSQKIGIILSPKYRASYIDHLNNNSINKTLNPNNSNTNIETYNQMINRININSKNKIFFKKDCNIAKNPINNSSSILRGENDEDKNLLLNKIFCEKTDKFFSVDKSGIKTRNINKIMRNREQRNFYSFKIKKIKNRNIFPKYIQKEFNNNNINQDHSQNCKNDKVV